jgi:hypothetical protein
MATQYRGERVDRLRFDAHDETAGPGPTQVAPSPAMGAAHQARRPPPQQQQRTQLRQSEKTLRRLQYSIVASATNRTRPPRAAARRHRTLKRLTVAPEQTRTSLTIVARATNAEDRRHCAVKRITRTGHDTDGARLGRTRG